MRWIFLVLTASSSSLFAADPHVGHVPPKEQSSVKTPSQESKEEPRVPVDVDAEKQKKMGLKTTVAKKAVVEHAIRTVATITADQTREAHVHTRINGWIEKIQADFVGKPVKKGQPLYELYSPELVATQEEFLAAKRQGAAAREISKAALDRLKLWEVPQREIDMIAATGRAKRAIVFDSPVGGFILNKTAIRGMYITPEMELYHIADLSRIWILATLYEYDIAVIKAGDKVELQFPHEPGKVIIGEISYIYPEIDPETRTAKARIELDNKDQTLKPGMFANVEIKKALGEAVIIPDDSLIDTGARKIVFVKSGDARFEPREVKVGPKVGRAFMVLKGLHGGEEVITSAHFLIDAESKFQAALQKGVTPGAHSGHGP